MSKPKTILDFFSKSPAAKSPTSNVNPKTSKYQEALISTPKSTSAKKTTPQLKSKRRTLEIDDDDHCNVEDEEVKSISKPKRKRIAIASESEDSADEYKPEKDEVSDDSESMPSEVSEDEDSPKPKKTKLSKPPISPALSCFINPKASPSGSQSPLISTPNGVKENGKIGDSPETPKTTPKLGTPVSRKKPAANGTPSGASEETLVEEANKEWTHDSLDWLNDEKIKDKYGKRKADPDYSPRTLYVPESFKKNLTPAMKQWWDLKVDHFDTVLFFKVGKFYELYHMDAVIGVKELGLVYMKGEFAHSGFPEISYGRYSDYLVEKGYKVARVEQTETPQMMEERVKGLSRPTKYDKVVTREICQITTKGTKMLNYQDEPMGANNNYLLAICEKHKNDSDSGSEYGICFVDTSIGKFRLGQFQDDRHGSRILTMIALYPPVEILYERSSFSKKSLQLLNNNLSNIPKEALNSGSQFWDTTKTLKFLTELEYFQTDDNSVQFPDAIQEMLDPDDRLNQTALKHYELAMKSFGACIWYLKECCIEDNLLSMKLFEEYKPADGIQIKPSSQRDFSKQHMVLDGVTLHNLEIVQTRPSDSAEGTLIGTMDHCSTSFGKRLLRHWLCSPLCNPDSISDRLDAVEDLIQIPEVIETVSLRLKKIPDLERLLSKIHSQGLFHSKEHPESRAIYYEADIYNKRKLTSFLSTLDGFKESIEVISNFESHLNDFKSSFLKENLSFTKDGGKFPDMTDTIKYFEDAFDHDLAKKEGKIIPTAGVDPEYDSATSDLEDIGNDLERYLNRIKEKLNCKVSYVGNGRTRFQLEVSDNKKVPESFEFQGARKGFKRYYTPEGREFLAKITVAEESRDAALRDVARRIFQQFDKNYDMWKSAVHCLSVLDVLISFYKYYKTSEVDMCRPQFVLPDQDTEPFLKVANGIHPTFLKYFTGSNYIPNNLYIGPKQNDQTENTNNGGRLVLVTGPNMGGKSTLMRQAGTLVIMAQVGSFVPATFMKLTPVDRIFTRVGASDHIIKGESTFFVEASETSCILHHATPDSFVLVDELGRGTATHDGTAIASAVLNYLVDEIKCRTLFSTHYHSLVEDVRSHPAVGLGHMACIVEEDETCPELEKITFLYKFADGACPKSYGFNVALIAGIPTDIVQEGHAKAQALEYTSKISKNLKTLLSRMTPEELAQKVNEKLKELQI